MEPVETPEHILRERKGDTSPNLLQVCLRSQAPASSAFGLQRQVFEGRPSVRQTV